MPSAPMPRWQRQTSAIASGFLGDWLESRRNPLAVSLALLHQNSELDPAYPCIDEPSGTLCLSIHGLMELETVWRMPGASGDSYGASLSSAIRGGVTDLVLRYNTGRPIYRNGRDLAQLLEQVVTSWPVPVTRLILLGHSMGGLVIRSACQSGQAAGHRWLKALSDCVYIGSPHDGSWLARGARSVAGMLNDMPRDYLKVIGEVIDLRSSGIRNLSRGDILEQGAGEAPLLPGARHYVVCGLLSRSRTHPVNALFGDALVHEASAQGLEQPGWQLAGMATFPGIDHIGLAHHPDVATQLQEWLV
ncbi:hypothetical protein QQF73_01250 [Marinobacter sp. M216]|uniref:Alpha/beta hydrolase n=1 Tax=Marinobacter albus TaxID=3030833 RepID=A0ABT7H796_9GAMM|nr:MULTISPECIES: hypothetical protein [unclassified Marinobacter]MBW7471489.1 hypothetical protein [Marinobacter sp. F4218]MDK9556233.1 hypothetical protein [Marinobacter sp. M216]